jgi:hypothetical protein
MIQTLYFLILYKIISFYSEYNLKLVNYSVLFYLLKLFLLYFV